MVRVLASSVVDWLLEPQSGQAKDWYLLLLRQARSIKEKEQRRVGLESE
jgi:hypothetical protein